MGALRALRDRYRASVKPRGVTVYTGGTAEHYPQAERWFYRDGKDHLDVLDRRGRLVATFPITTWLRVEAGPYAPPETPAQ